MSEQGTALEQRPDAPPAERDTSRAASALAELEEMRYFIQKQMHEDLDFGKIPGTGSKPTLLKPGAQKIAMYFNTRPSYEWRTRELGEGHVEHVVTAHLIHRATGEVIAEGLGSCTTMETKYRFRAASRVCPSCGSDALRKSKRDPEYYCWTKIGGCGATFADSDPVITSQPLGKAENDNIWDTRNTVLKMAEKRAFIDATVGLACLSQFFTQDLDDFQGFAGQDTAVTVEPVPTRQQQPATAEKPAVPEPHPLAQTLGERVKTLTETTGETKEGILSRVCDIEGLRRNGRIDFSTFTEDDYRRVITRVEREIESARAELAASETDADIAQALPF